MKNVTQVAKDNPEAIYELFRDRYANPGEVAYAAEALGGAKDSTRAVSELIDLLDRGVSTVVQVSAIYGLEPHWKDPRVEMVLKNFVAHHHSTVVRQSAQESLHNISFFKETEPNG